MASWKASTTGVSANPGGSPGYAPENAGRCPRCYLPTRLCLCAEVPRLDTRTEFLVIRHNKEKEKSTNTARMAALSLSRCRVLTYGAPGQPFDPVQVVLDRRAEHQVVRDAHLRQRAAARRRGDEEAEFHVSLPVGSVR